MKIAPAPFVAVLVLGSCALIGRAFAADPSSDRDFAVEAARAGAAEVALGHLATWRGHSQGVKTFGQHMVDDHTRAGEALKAAASKDGVDLPDDDGGKPAADDRLANLRGTEFDRAYAATMVDDHEKAVALFRGEAQQGTQPNLKAFARKTLPTLEEHLRMARALQRGAQTRNDKHNDDLDARP